MANATSRLTIAIDSARARSNAESLAKSLDKTTVAGTKASASAKATAASYRLAATAATGYIGALSVGAITNDLQRLQGINSRLESLTGDLAGQQAYLSTTAKELSADYTVLADGYAKLLPLYEAGVVTLDETRKLTEGLANVQTATGASSASLGQSIYGLSQTLAAGTVNMEDYRQVVDSLPGLNNKVAAAFGVTVGGLKDLISSGTLASEVFKGPLLQAFREYDGAAAARADNIEQTFNRTKNAYLEAVAAFETPISGAAVTSANAVAEAFDLIAANADLIVDGVQVAGTVIAASFGGSALASVGSYSAALLQAAARTTTLQAIQQGSLATTNLETVARLAAAQAATREAAANVLSAESAVARAAGTEASVAASARLTAAREAAAVATANLARAETAAIAATGRLTAAQRASAVAATAQAAAMRAGSGALALVGGPAGLALLAAGGIYYLATQQTEASKAADSLSDAMKGLNEAYKANATAASASADATIQAQEANIVSLKARFEELKTVREAAVGSLKDGASSTDTRTSLEFAQITREINSAEAALNEFKRSNDQLGNAAALITYSDRLEKALSDAAKAANISATDIQAAYDKLLPADSKIAALESQLAKFEKAYSAGIGINDQQIVAVRKAIADQIASLDPLNDAREKAAQVAEDYADRVKSALDIALPDLARSEEQIAQMQLLHTEYEKGGDSAALYGRAIDSLQEQFDAEKIERQADAVQKFNDILSRPVNDPFGSYRTDIALLDEALTALPDKAQAIQLAMSRLDLDIQADLTVVESSSNRAVTQAAYDAQLTALEEFHKVRNVSEEQAQQNIVALAKSYAEQVAAIHEQEFAKIQSFQDQYATQPDSAGLALTASYDGAKAQAAAIADATQRTDTLLGIEQTYQERVTELVRAGEATRAQTEGAAGADRLAGLINGHQEEISAIGGFVEAALSLRANREKIEADEALSTAKNLAEIAADAQAVYKQSGLETDRILAEQASARAQVAEDTARREFKQQKKAQLAQARLSQLLAIMNAYATGGSWITGLAFAATAGIATQQVIDNIQAQQFNGGSANLATNNTSAQTIPSVTPQTQTQAQVTPSAGVVYIVSGNFQSADEAVAQQARMQKMASDRGWITYENGSPDFGNVPKEIIRLNG